MRKSWPWQNFSQIGQLVQKLWPKSWKKALFRNRVPGTNYPVPGYPDFANYPVLVTRFLTSLLRDSNSLRANPYSFGFGQRNWDFCLKMLWIVCVARNYLFFLSSYLVSIRNLASKLQKSWFCLVNLANFEKVPDGGRWYTKIWI